MAFQMNVCFEMQIMQWGSGYADVYDNVMMMSS